MVHYSNIRAMVAKLSYHCFFLGKASKGKKSAILCISFSMFLMIKTP